MVDLTSRSGGLGIVEPRVWDESLHKGWMFEAREESLPTRGRNWGKGR
jgi:hypothetical protein